MHEQYSQYGSPIIKLVEEMSELTVVLCKAERFGLDNFYPQDPQKITNRVSIKEKIADIQHAIQNLLNWMETVPEGDVKC